MTFGLSWISLGVPRAITSPKSITVIRSQMPMTTRIWCSISRMVSLKRSRMKWISSISCTISARVHAGGRLVQQQQARVAGQGPGDLHPALLAVGQVLGELVLRCPPA